MQAITTIGLDIAKSVFQVHGVDAQGGVVIRRQLKRRFVLAFYLADIAGTGAPSLHRERNNWCSAG
jgi:transposase